MGLWLILQNCRTLLSCKTCLCVKKNDFCENVTMVLFVLEKGKRAPFPICCLVSLAWRLILPPLFSPAAAPDCAVNKRLVWPRTGEAIQSRRCGSARASRRSLMCQRDLATPSRPRPRPHRYTPCSVPFWAGRALFPERLMRSRPDTADLARRR